MISRRLLCRRMLFISGGLTALFCLSGCSRSVTPSQQSTVQATAVSTTQDHWFPDQVRPLPGQLDTMPMFNSNSPEWIKQPGILLSTFPGAGKSDPKTHLNYSFTGAFTLFSHHFSHTPPDLKTLYLGVIVHNPNSTKVSIEIPAAASYLLDSAPFIQQPSLVENPEGTVYSGPGVRAVDQVLREKRQPDLPESLSIPPGQYRMLLNHAIPVKGLAKPINGRSTFMRLNSSGSVHIAELAMYAPKTSTGEERPPTQAEWQKLLLSGGLAGPRDKTPTPPGQGGSLIYGRVAGVQEGSTWATTLSDPGQTMLAIPEPGEGISYAVSTLRAGRLGTKQTQAAKLLVRYPDTAYEAHGNYAVYYDLSLPLFNASETAKTVEITLATPIKVDTLGSKGLHFRTPPQTHPFFRGTVRIKTQTDEKTFKTRYVHLWQRTGQWVDPIATVTIPPQSTQQMTVDFLYPPDSTPPQILRIATLP